jgi:hypothetical protein
MRCRESMAAMRVWLKETEVNKRRTCCFLDNLHHPRLAQVGAVDHAAVAKGMGIDDRRIARDQVGGEPSRRWPDAEAEGRL